MNNGMFRCENCLYYDEVEEGIGICRRYPPNYTPNLEKRFTNRDLWCGELTFRKMLN